MKFNELGLSEKVLKAVEASGYDTPTPIQAQAIPHALQGRDVLGIAQTGTGKTAAFTLPMLSLLERGRARARMPRTLILEPTRELAAQVEEASANTAVNHKLNLALLIGGVSFGDQETKIDARRRRADRHARPPARLHRARQAAAHRRSRSWSSTKPTACSTWASSRTSSASASWCRSRARRCSSRRPCRRRSPGSTEQFLHNPVRVEVSRAATTGENITQALVASAPSAGDKRAALRR